MIKASWADLRPLINNKDISVDLIIKAWDINNIKTHVEWIRFDKLDELSIQYCSSKGINPDTALMIYEMPKDNLNGDPVDEDIMQYQLANASLNNSVHCICCFYPNMTLEKLANSINQVYNMRAFL